MAEGSRLVVFEKDRLGAGGAGEIAELGAGELEETRRRRCIRPALEEGEGGEQCGSGRNGEIEVHLERDRVARGGGGKVRREVEAKHVIAAGEVSGNKRNAKPL